MYVVQQDDGAAMYGSKYKSMAALVSSHLQGAADRMCEHWRDDAGARARCRATRARLRAARRFVDAARDEAAHCCTPPAAAQASSCIT